MRKLLIILFLLTLLLTATPVQPATTVSGRPCPGGSGSLSCTGATQQAPVDMDDAGSTATMFRYGTNDWFGTEVPYTGTTGTLCRVDVWLKKILSATGTITLYIYPDSGSATGSSASATCSTLDASTISTDGDWYSFTCDYGIANGTTYWLVLTKNSVDATNYVEWGTDTTCGTEHAVYSADGATWSDQATTYCFMNRLYIKE